MQTPKKHFRRILIIDDDTAGRFLAKLSLEDMDAAETIQGVGSAQEGLTFIKQHCLNEQAAKEDCPDLILLDINMPIMDGFEFLEQLQAIGQSNLIRAVIVVLSSSSNPKDIHRMQSLGVRGFISKPITEEKIRSLT